MTNLIMRWIVTFFNEEKRVIHAEMYMTLGEIESILMKTNGITVGNVISIIPVKSDL